MSATGVSYRRARASDARACATIIRDWGEETSWLGPVDELEPMAAFWAELLSSETAWVAERGGAVIGFCVREDDNIGGLYVARAARGRGVGRALLDRAKEDRDWITVWAYRANAAARRFYRREGLVEISCEPEEETGLMNIEHRWTRGAPPAPDAEWTR